MHPGSARCAMEEAVSDSIRSNKIGFVLANLVGDQVVIMLKDSSEVHGKLLAAVDGKLVLHLKGNRKNETVEYPFANIALVSRSSSSNMLRGIGIGAIILGVVTSLYYMIGLSKS